MMKPSVYDFFNIKSAYGAMIKINKQKFLTWKSLSAVKRISMFEP